MLQNSTIHVIDLNQIGDCKMKSLLTTLQGLLVREPSDLTSQTIDFRHKSKNVQFI